MPSLSPRAPLIAYFRVLDAHKKFIVLCTVSGAILSVVVSLLLPKQYDARALIMAPQVGDQGLVSSFVSQAGGMSLPDIFGKNGQADLYASLLQSEAVKNGVINRFGYMKEFDSRRDAQRAIGRKLTVEIGKKDGIVSVVAEDKDPQRAADLANTFVDELNNLVMTMNIQDAGQSRRFFEGRIQIARSEMERLEGKMKAFRTSTKTVDVQEQAKATIAGISTLRSQLAEQEVRLAELRTAHTDQSPEVINVLAAVAKLRRQIGVLEGRGGGSGVPSLGTVPALGEEYARIQRDLKVQEALLETLTKQYELARLTETKTVPPVVIIQRAEVPDKKTRPKRSIIVIFSTFACFVGAVAWSFFREFIGKVPQDERLEWLELWRGMKMWRPER